MRVGGVPAGVRPTECAVSATAGDCRGDEAGTSSVREGTNMGGSRGVAAYRSRSISSGSRSMSMALALSTSMARGVGTSSLRCSLLVRAGVDVGGEYSVARSMVDAW